jgi:hypothetical protein
MSVLRQLVDADRLKKDPAAELLDAALVVKRAGLEHLVTEATGVEVHALAKAGEILAKERIAALVLALSDPTRAIAPFDGGAASGREVLHLALAEARRS